MEKLSGSAFTILALGAIIAVIIIAAPNFADNQQKNNKPPPAPQKDGCQLIANCTAGTYCAIQNATVKYGSRPFENYLYPKCVSSPEEVDENAENDGNQHVVRDGPGCNLLKCDSADGYSCYANVLVMKIGNMPYATAIYGWPECLLKGGNPAVVPTIIDNGPGCDQIVCKSRDQKCVTWTFVGKYGSLPYAQTMWPICVSSS